MYVYKLLWDKQVTFVVFFFTGTGIDIIIVQYIAVFGQYALS